MIELFKLECGKKKKEKYKNIKYWFTNGKRERVYREKECVSLADSLAVNAVTQRWYNN